MEMAGAGMSSRTVSSVDVIVGFNSASSRFAEMRKKQMEKAMTMLRIHSSFKNRFGVSMV